MQSQPLRPFFALLASLALAHSAAAQGALTPSAAPAPTGKSLAQIEPRIDIATLAGTATSVVTISTTGSYYLSANLSGAPGKDTIVVSAAGVTIDLNGFSLVGTDAARVGLLATSGAAVTVRNGRVVGGTYGVRTTSRACLQDLIVEGGTTQGISTTTDSTVERCRVSAAGIAVSTRGVVTDCITTGANGIATGSHATVLRCRVSAGGISTGDNALVSDCVVDDAPGFGISAGDAATVRNCTVQVSARSGIVVGQRSRISHCAVRDVVGIAANADGGFASAAGGIETVLDACSAGNSGVPGFNFTSSTQFRNCVSTNSTGAGFVGGGQCRFSDCIASGNSGVGISAGNRSILTGCIANTNGAGGIYLTGSGGILDRCLAAANTGGSGLRVDTGTIRDCEARENQGGAGIRCSTGSHLLRNASNFNGVVATPQNGFLVEGGRSRVDSNQAYNNTGFGFEITNTSSTNSVLVIGNSAGSNDGGEFSIGAGNAAGPIIAPTGVSTNTVVGANYNL